MPNDHNNALAVPTSPDGSLSGAAFRPGALVGKGRFALVRLLGQGGKGLIWLAHDGRLVQPVALKFLPPQIGADPVALADLRRETLSSLKFTHPKIIRIYDFYEAPGEAAFISMEYVDGPNLGALRLQQTGWIFPREFLRPLVKQMCGPKPVETPHE